MSGKHMDNTPVDLHDQELHFPEHRFVEHVRENELYNHQSATISEKPPNVLPILALNEVFIGESLSARLVKAKVQAKGFVNILRISQEFYNHTYDQAA